MSAATMASTTSNPTSDDEKSHTFRKRRLSLSKHHLAPSKNEDSSPSSDVISGEPATAAVAATAAASFDDDHEGSPPLTHVMAPGTDDGSTAAESAASDQKAQTFRKRRLSVTLKPFKEVVDNDGSDREADSGDKHDNETLEQTALPAHKVQKTSHEPAGMTRSRRASDASASSITSNKSGEGLKVRTLHAGEIIGQHAPCPPSPAFDYTGMRNQSNIPEETHVLYRQSRPSQLSLLQVASTEENAAQPKWKKRIVRKHDEDERKLPFPRDIVGTYSCHGVEPVYDSDYEHMEDDDEEEWTEDISGAKSVPTASMEPLGMELPAKEQKPSTAAKINQDRGGVAFPYGNCPRTALFAVYDGHGQGGELVSQFALHEVQSRLEKQPTFSTNLEKAFIDTFLAVDEALAREPLIEPLYAGTTACVALLRDNKLTVANAGDSRAVVARRVKSPDGSDAVAYQAIDLTVDQNPDLPEERERIESMGGFVSPPPEPGLSARVWLDSGFSQIGLAMARSIGDHAVAQVGVIAEPVVTTHDVAKEDQFIILASDGVWEFISSEAAVEIVGANLSRGATKATQALIEAAAARWHEEEGDYRDDITALVIRLSELWRDESPAPAAAAPDRSGDQLSKK